MNYIRPYATALSLPGLFGGGAADPATALLAKLQTAATAHDVTLEYNDASSRYVWTPAGNDRYWVRWRLNLQATGFWSLRNADFFDVVSAVASDDVGLTYSGTWQTVTNQYQSIAEQWVRTDTLGSYVEYTFTGQDHVYIITYTGDNAGYGDVTINGGTDLVNELAGAQLNCYSAAPGPNTRVLAASGLDPGETYTIRITHTDTKPPESSREYVYVEGFGFRATTINDAAVYDITNAAKSLRNIGYSGSTYESAISYKPAGASGYSWTGSDHGSEDITSVTWLDASETDQSVSVGTPRNNASQITLTMAGTSRHPDTSTTDHATVLYTTTFNSEGVTVYHKHTWLSNADIDLAFPVMFPVREEIDQGIVAGDTAVRTLTADDNSHLGQRRARACACWDAGTDQVAYVYIVDFAPVANWGSANEYAYIEDRTGGTLNKMYFERVGSTAEQANASVIAGAVWQSTAYYRIVQFSDPDNNLL